MTRAIADCTRLQSSYKNGVLTVKRVFDRSRLASALRHAWALARRNRAQVLADRAADAALIEKAAVEGFTTFARLMPRVLAHRAAIKAAQLASRDAEFLAAAE
ncbi:hypothetical protein [Alsobacter metallidurans]|nr:hypothetical protein [Alsobacter metallidurans]